MKAKKIMLLITWIITLLLVIADTLKITVFAWISSTYTALSWIGLITFIISLIINISIGNYLYEEINKY